MRESPLGSVSNPRAGALGDLALRIRGAGSIALFAGFELLHPVWVIGYAVVLPIAPIAPGEATDDEAP